jgi:hypothetical protein
MFATLSDTIKAVAFSVLVMVVTLAAVGTVCMANSPCTSP